MPTLSSSGLWLPSWSSPSCSAFFAAMWLISRNYLKVSPNAVAVLSGRKRKLPDGRVVGYRMVRGGAALRIPLLEKVEYLHLNVMTIPLEIKRAYTLKGVPVSVKAVANVKIRGDDTSLQAAAERFLGMTHDQVQKVIFQTLEGHLRSILGTLTVEEVNSDRQSFAQKLTSEAAADLEKMGHRRRRADDPGDQRRGGVPERARQAAHRRGQARRDHRRGRSAPRREDQVVAGAAGRGAGEVQGRRRDLAGVARLHDPPGAVPGGDRDAEGARAAGRPALGGDRAAGGRRRGSQDRADAHAGDDRGPGAGSPPQAEGARSDRHQAGGSRSAGRRRPRGGGEAVGDSRSGRPPVRDDRAWPKPSRRSCARKAPAARPRSRPKGAPKPRRSKRSVSRRPRRSKLRASPKRPPSCARRKRGRSSTTPRGCRRSSRSCRRSSKASSGVFGAVAAPLGNIDKLVVIDQGNGNGENGSGSLGRLAKTSPAVVFNLLQQLEALGLSVPGVSAAARRLGTSRPRRPRRRSCRWWRRPTAGSRPPDQLTDVLRPTDRGLTPSPGCG